VRFVPLIAGLAASAALAPALLRGLAEGGFVRQNYRGAHLPCPFGIVLALALILAAALTASVALLDDDPSVLPVGLAFVLGVAFLGLVDDQFTTSSRGLRGHLKGVLRGELSTGAIKAVGTAALALVVVAEGRLLFGDSVADSALAFAILVLATNLFNLLDLRPGRTLKAFALVALGCLPALDGDTLRQLGLFVGPIVVAGLYDLRERAMLGDSGSNVIGAVAGLFLVAAASGSTVALGAIAAALLLVTLYGEVRSINALVESTPGLKHLDSLGRPA